MLTADQAAEFWRLLRGRRTAHPPARGRSGRIERRRATRRPFHRQAADRRLSVPRRRLCFRFPHPGTLRPRGSRPSARIACPEAAGVLGLDSTRLVWLEPGPGGRPVANAVARSLFGRSRASRILGRRRSGSGNAARTDPFPAGEMAGGWGDARPRAGGTPWRIPRARSGHRGVRGGRGRRAAHPGWFRDSLRRLLARFAAAPETPAAAASRGPAVRRPGHAGNASAASWRRPIPPARTELDGPAGTGRPALRRTPIARSRAGRRAGRPGRGLWRHRPRGRRRRVLAERRGGIARSPAGMAGKAARGGRRAKFTDQSGGLDRWLSSRPSRRRPRCRRVYRLGRFLRRRRPPSPARCSGFWRSSISTSRRSWSGRRGWLAWRCSLRWRRARAGRQRDRVLDRLADRGPGLDLDEPSFLRFHGTSADLFQTAREWLVRAVREPARAWILRHGESGRLRSLPETEAGLLCPDDAGLGLGCLGERWSRATGPPAESCWPAVPAWQSNRPDTVLGDLFLQRVKDARPRRQAGAAGGSSQTDRRVAVPGVLGRPAPSIRASWSRSIAFAPIAGWN